MSKVEASLAFVFDDTFSQVLLIQKEKPVQHAGLLNGLGGKLELNETHAQCVVREIAEEAAILIPESQIIRVGDMSWEHWFVSIWTTTIIKKPLTNSAENNVSWHPTQPLPKNIIANLSWLIPLSIDINQQKKASQPTPLLKINY